MRFLSAYIYAYTEHGVYVSFFLLDSNAPFVLFARGREREGRDAVLEKVPLLHYDNVGNNNAD